MDKVLFTILGAIVLMGIVVICLAIGRLITGKNRLRKGCGMTPSKNDKTTTCSICGAEKMCEKEEKEVDKE